MMLASLVRVSRGHGRDLVIAVVGVLVVVAVGMVAWWWPRDAGGTVVLAGLEVRDGAGARVALVGELRPVSLVHFWATWCGPCREEVPKLLGLMAEDARLGLVMVAVADTPQAVTAFLDGTGVSVAGVRVVHDDWTVAHALGTVALPESHLVVDGRVVESFVGAQGWDGETMRRRLDAAITRAMANP